MIIIILVLLGWLFIPVSVLAGGGIAISGSFAQQEFRIPQGASVSGPDINVVVFNNSGEPLKVRMTGQAPAGVNIGLSESEFTLPPDGNKAIIINVTVGENVAPGEYEISVAAESYREGVTGIQLAGAAQQNARLIVTGESATVSIKAVSTSGEPLVAMIRLYRVISGQSQEVAYSETGVLELKVAPGDFRASCFIGGREVASQSFTLKASEKKVVELSGATVYFEGFSLVPNYFSDTGKLAFVQLVYSVRNLYQRVEKGEVWLEVCFEGNLKERLLLVNLSPLELGNLGLNYNYMPSGGWSNGTYEFRLQLYIDGQFYISSRAETLQISGGKIAGVTDLAKKGQVSTDKEVKWNSPLLIGGIVGVVVIAGIIIFLFTRLLRRG